MSNDCCGIDAVAKPLTAQEMQACLANDQGVPTLRQVQAVYDATGVDRMSLPEYVARILMGRSGSNAAGG